MNWQRYINDIPGIGYTIGERRDPADIRRIIIHCAATPPSMDVSADDINEWHRAKGWAGIGYHFVIRRDGTVERGRHLDRVGAHASGHNSHSIGVCLVGGVDEDRKPEENYSLEQWRALHDLVYALSLRWKNLYNVVLGIHGHNEYAAKACPSFDVEAWRRTQYFPWVEMQERAAGGLVAEHTYEAGYRAGIKAALEALKGTVEFLEDSVP